jgi:hypothetical protein
MENVDKLSNGPEAEEQDSRVVVAAKVAGRILLGATEVGLGLGFAAATGGLGAVGGMMVAGAGAYRIYETVTGQVSGERSAEQNTGLLTIARRIGSFVLGAVETVEGFLVAALSTATSNVVGMTAGLVVLGAGWSRVVKAVVPDSTVDRWMSSWHEADRATPSES